MAQLLYERDIEFELIKRKRVAVIGYGNQGHAHALNLRDSGINIRVGARPGGDAWKRALQDGFDPYLMGECVEWADIVMLTLPDVPMKEIYSEHVGPNLRPDQLLLFAHGFNILYGLIEPPNFVDVALVSPKGAGYKLRKEFISGSGMCAMVAVHQDFTKLAKDLTLSYALGIGAAKGGVLMTTFKEETETDLFGEQTVLCGGIPELIKAAFETLVEAGYSPEAAYFECVHEAKLITDLIYKGGLKFMRESISDTAEWGGYEAGPKVISEESRKAMRETLSAIQNGAFAERWMAESNAKQPNLQKLRNAEAQHPVEDVGNVLRAGMPFLKSE
ncbi:MAG: ketol-acid reductoisomerase [Fimbriimonadaceae bacterium]|nr:ketol-acid reductoisomerase [Fimbriimonadaceae bacterium]